MVYRYQIVSLLFIIGLHSPGTLFSKTWHIGEGHDYPNLQPAVNAVSPGDTVFFHRGVYQGSQTADIRGRENEWIVIQAEEGVIVRSGTSGWHLIQSTYLEISGFTFEGQTGNGFNMDDGGSHESPSHHIIFKDCRFRDINALGNNDLLKLSGVREFEITSCEFENGAAGGSGIDMVGCHAGTIRQSQFTNMGSNAIQAKGGSDSLVIERNFFLNGGQRSINLGGSTGTSYFRPPDAPYEAAYLSVFSNIFVGSIAPIAFVGAVHCHVINNTIITPEKWVVRILQESVDENRFIECGDNSFQNNLISLGNLSTETNVGPNTRPESFIFRANFWHNTQNRNWTGPQIPVNDPLQRINRDPQFRDPENQNYGLREDSPAIGAVDFDGDPKLDYYGKPFSSPRSVGAVEGGASVKVNKGRERQTDDPMCRVYPNPFNDSVNFTYTLPFSSRINLGVYDIRGRMIYTIVDQHQVPGVYVKPVTFENTVTGLYLYRFQYGSNVEIGKLLHIR